MATDADEILLHARVRLEQAADTARKFLKEVLQRGLWKLFLREYEGKIKL